MAISEIVAGDSVRWVDSFVDYLPSDGWSLAYILVNESERHVLAAQVDGDDYVISISSAVSRVWGAGRFNLVAQVSRGDDERVTVYRGVLVVAGDPENSSYDPRTFNQKVLDSLMAAFEGRASRIEKSYQINGRSIELMTHEELLLSIKQYERRVLIDSKKKKGISSNKIVMGF